MFLLHVLLLLALTLHTPALLCNPQFPGSRHPSSCQELEKPLSGGQTSSPPTLPRCLPCPALRPPLLYKQMAWQPGRQGSYQRMGEARLQPAPGPCSPPIPRHVKAVPELGPLSLLRGLHLSPPPSFQEDCGSKAWYSGTDDPLTAGALAGLLGMLPHAVTAPCVCLRAPTPSLPPQHRSLRVWGGTGPCAGLPVGKGQLSC